MALLDKQGHRGCRGLLPENTIAAMMKAIDLGVSTLEMDVVITADGEVVLSHEPFFNQEITTKPDGSIVAEAEEKTLNIYQMRYEEVMRYDVGLKLHPRFPDQEKQAANKPLLKTLIDGVKEYCRLKNIDLPYFNIETKSTPSTDNLFHPAPPEFVEKLVAVVQEKNISEKVIIQSFDFRTLRYLYQHYPSFKTAMLIEEDDSRTMDEQLADLGFIPTIYSPYFGLVTKESIAACHEVGMKVIPWTVNDPQEILRLVSQGVDGIITDYPNLFVELGC